MVFSSHIVTFRTNAYITDRCLLVLLGSFFRMVMQPSPSMSPAAQAISVFFMSIVLRTWSPVVALVYHCWWHDHVMKARNIVLIRGRLRFGGSTVNAPFPSCIVVFDQFHRGNFPLFTTMDRILDKKDAA